MVHAVDAVDDGVAHVEVARSEVDFGAERHAAVGEFSRSHAGEQVKALLDRTVAVGTFRGRLCIAAVLAHLLGRQLADIGETLLNQLDREVIHLLKVLGRVEEAVVPVEAQPRDILFDRVDVLDVLLGGVGVVHAQVADAAEFLCGREVDADCLGVSDVEIAVRLGRETGVNLFALVSAALGDVLLDKIVNEVTCHNLVVVFHVLMPPCSACPDRFPVF